MRWLFLLLSLFAASGARGDFPLNSAPLLPTTYSCSEPAIASFGSTQVVVWVENVRTTSRVHIRFLDGEEVVVTQAACSTCAYGVFASSSGSEVFIAAAGGLYRVDAARRIVRIGTAPAAMVYVAANDESLLIVRREGTTMKATLLDRDGGNAREVGLSDSSWGYGVAVAAAPDAFFVAWIDWNDNTVRTVLLRSTDAIAGAVETTPSNHVASPKVVRAGSGFLLVWGQRDGHLWDLMTCRFSGDGAPVGPPRIGGQFDAAYPAYGDALVETSDGFRLLTTDSDPFAHIKIMRLASDGTFVDSIDIGRADSASSLAVADDGTALIVHREWVAAFDIKLTRVGTDHSIVDSVLSLTPPVQRTLALFPAGNGYAAVWSESRNVMFGRFTAAGEPLDGDGIAIASGITSNVAAASNGDAVLIAWSMDRVNTAFVPLAEPSKFTTRVADEHVSSPIAVVAGDRSFVVAWTYESWEFKVHARLVSAADGSFASDVKTVIDLTWQNMVPEWVTVSAPRIAWNGTDFLFAWQQPQHWDDVYDREGVEPRTMEKGDPFAQLVSPSLVPIGGPIDLAHGPQDHTDFAGLTIAPTGDGWLATWLRTGSDPALFSARLGASGGATRDPIGGVIVPWVGATVPPVLGATHFAALRANGSRFDTLLPDGRTLDVTELPDNATIDAVCLECPLPSIAYSLRFDDGSERAYVGALTPRRRGAGR